MRVVVTTNAILDIENIYNWIASDSIANAVSVKRRIAHAIDVRIASNPFIGRFGKIEGTREWVVPGLPYVITYRVDQAQNTLTVAGVVHGARNR